MVLQITVLVASFLFIANKTFLLLPQFAVREGIKWAFGTLAAVMFIVYFFWIGSPIFSTLEIGLAVLSLYRTIVGKNRKSAVENRLGWFTFIAILALFYFRYWGKMETLQFGGAVFMLVGTFSLIRDQKKVGFTLYALGHVCATIYGWQIGQNIFWPLQLLQAGMCLTIFTKDDDTRSSIIAVLFCVIVMSGICLYLHDSTIFFHR